MSDTTDLVRSRPAEPDEDNAKRRQIVKGASSVFLARGFDATSMMDIAKAAGVSKGTLYVYFKDKEQLFSAIVQQECGCQAESAFQLDDNDHDVESVLTRIGREYAKFLCSEGKASSLRIVIAIADRMPEIGKTFYESGPANGIARLRSYLEAQVRAGFLVIDDCELAAAQFLETCHATLFKPVLFNFAPPPPIERIHHVVGTAVRIFLAAYRTTSTDAAN